MINVKIYIEGKQLNLISDETITLKSSVQNINDISKVFADLTQSFTVPASYENNKVFKHYYNADITGGFDARTKKSAQIYLNTELYKKGKIRLLSTSLENNKIVNYKIQFEGDVINVKDVLGDDKLNDLIFEDLNHEYNSDNIKEGLESSLFTGKIIYPLISPIRRFLYDSSDTVTSNDTQVNIHYNSGIADNSIKYTELKPAIKISEIINKIQDQYNLSFIGDFFVRDYYTSLYMWLNKDEGLLNTTSQTTSNIVNWDGGSSLYVDFTTNTYTPVLSSSAFLSYYVNTLSIVPSVGFEDIEYNIVILKNGIESSRLNNNTGSNNLNFTYYPFITGETLEANYTFFIECASTFTYTAVLNQNKVVEGTPSPTEITTASINTIVGTVEISKQMPNIKIYDFLVGIIKMFNISLTSDIDSNIIWEVLPEWYNKGKVIKNFEKYINVEKTIIKRGSLNNEFVFNFKEPKTLLAEQYNSNNGISYGDLEAKLTDEDGKILDGNKLEIKLPFENIIFERIIDSDTNIFTNLQYGYAVDKELNPVVTDPVLFYNNNLPIENIGFFDDTSTTINLNTSINIPSNNVNISDDTSQTNLFGSEISTYTFSLMNNSLYNRSYKDYVTDMFNNQRRQYINEAEIPAHILTNINLNDRLIILNRRYIINSINSELTTGKTKLELLNDIYNSGDLLTDTFYVTPKINFAKSSLETYTATVYSNKSINITNFDEGNGIFVTINSPQNVQNIATINYTVPANNTGANRIQSILFQDNNSLENVKLLITQQPTESVTFDSTQITFDNNILTFDNG